MPVFAHLHWVIKYGGLSSIVLPIVCVHANISFMVIFTIGTPYGLKVKDIEVHIGLELLDKLYWEFFLVVCERTELSVITFLVLAIEIRRAEFCLIFIWVIELFNSVVSLVTRFFVRALLMSTMSWFSIIALFWLIHAQWTPAILFIVMIERTFLQIVTLWITCAGLSFEKIQVQERNALIHWHILCTIIAILFNNTVLQFWLLVRYSSSCVMQVHVLLGLYILARSRRSPVPIHRVIVILRPFLLAVTTELLLRNPLGWHVPDRVLSLLSIPRIILATLKWCIVWQVVPHVVAVQSHTLRTFPLISTFVCQGHVIVLL